MAAGDLTTLANVKSWLNISSSTDDALLTRLVTAASAFIQSWLNRTIATGSYTETRNGRNEYALAFGNFPVTAVASVTIDGAAIPVAPDAVSDGYVFSATMLYLRGYQFTKGYGNVVVTYTAGYAATPADVEQACIELVSLKYKRRDHPDQASKSIGGAETVSYITKDMTDEIKTLLIQYRKVVPIL